MSTRLVRGTGNQQGRNIFVHPGNRFKRHRKRTWLSASLRWSAIIRCSLSPVRLCGGMRSCTSSRERAGAHREINILLGSNIQAGKLVVGVTRSLPGNWTSWPPHEHVAMLEEIYVFVDMPAPSFGLQLVYTDGISAAEVEVVRDGDAVLLPEGYHPNVAIPGATLNFVWIMAAHREGIDRKWAWCKLIPDMPDFFDRMQVLLSYGFHYPLSLIPPWNPVFSLR